MIQLLAHAEGCILPVRAQPGARRQEIVGEHHGALKVAVNAPPQDGRANQALIEVLCQALDRKRSQVVLLSGPTSRDKKFLIRGMQPNQLQEHLAALLKTYTARGQD